MFSFCASYAQEAFKGTYHNSDLGIRIKLNLEADNIPVPGLELDSCYGYIQGNIYGSWIILKVKSVSENKAVVRVMSERGDVAEDLKLTMSEEGLKMEQVKDAYIKGVANRKYVKLPSVIILTKD